MIKQLNGAYVVKWQTQVPYHERAKHLMAQFEKIKVTHAERGFNDRADALASLAASLQTLPSDRFVEIIVGEIRVLLPRLVYLPASSLVLFLSIQ